MDMSACIGRVGGLAVALGVGAAVVSGQVGAGAAWAQPGADGTSTTDSAHDSTTKDSTTGVDAEPEPKDEESAKETVDTGEAESDDVTQETDDERDEAADGNDIEVEDEDEDEGVKPPDRDSNRQRKSDVSATAMPEAPVAETTSANRVQAEDVSQAASQPVPTEEPPRVEDAEPEMQSAVLTSAIDLGDAEVRAPIRPLTTTANLVSNVVAAIFAPFATGTPTAPAPAVPLAAMALARREFGGALMTDAPSVESVATPLTATAGEFTGQPSLIAQVVTFGLRLIKPVLSLFGFDLNGTTARIPFFTDGIPPFFVTLGLEVTRSEYEGWQVWTLAPPNPTDKVVVAVHGGSFISTASLFHWWTYSDLARQTGATVVVPMYPLANEDGSGGTAKTVVPMMADFVAAQVAEHGRDNVSVLGDSAGGSIALAAAQQLVIRCNGDQACLDATLPGRMELMSPVLDAGVSNPAVADVDDPLLNPEISKRNGQWWAKGLETPDDPDGTKNPLASPLFGSLEGLPPTAVYAGSLDSRTPDVLVLQQKVNTTPGVDFTFELRKGQIHDWTIFGFLPDAHAERPNIYRDLGLTNDS